MGSTTTAVASRKRRRADVEPDINVTPLVDVVLVLLIIFMVIAPELEHGERVELPAITAPDDVPKPKIEPVEVTISAAGSLFLGKEPLQDTASLVGRLRAAREAEPDRKVVLKGDASLPYSKLRGLLVELQSAGLPGVQLSVTEKSDKGVKTAAAEAR